MRRTVLICFLSAMFSTGVMADSKETVTVNGTVVGKQATHMTFDGDNVTLSYSDGTSQSADITAVNVAFDYVATFKDNSFDNLTTIKTFGGQMMKAEVTRTMEAGEWSPLCLPFNMSSTDITSIFGSGTQVATLDNVSTTAINFATVREIKAGVPYIIKPANRIETFTVNNVLIGKMAEGSSAETDNASFTGTINSTAPTGNIYYLGAGNMLKPLVESNSISPLRAYLKTSSAITGGGRLLGDLNNDGQLSLIDITLAVSAILGDDTIDQSLADFDNNGEISLYDVTCIVDIILNDEGFITISDIQILVDGEPSGIGFNSTQGNGSDQAANSINIWQ